jgi:hypothetical protein
MTTKFITGSWENDDIDLLPTIKLRYGSKTDMEKLIEVRVTSIAICWLKWGLMFSFGRTYEFDSDGKYKSK